MRKQINTDARERILKTADDLFYRQGYQNTGVNQLIEEADVAKASFYSNFSSKKKLLIAYLKQRHADWFKQLYANLEKHTTPGDKIAGLFEFLEHWITKTNYRGCAFININSELPNDNGEIASIVRDHKNQLRELISDLVNELNRKESFREEESLLVDAIYLLFEGAITECQNYRKIWPVKRSLETVQMIL